MAQNITLQGAQYSDVPAVELPKTGGGTASFTDVSDTTAAASDVASGKYFYTSAGVKTAGTASGGGGAGVVVTDTTDVHGGTIREITAVDLSSDTVTAASMLSGVTAHNSSGAAVTGSIVTYTSSDLTASGDTVSVPAGYYATTASKAVASGSATTPATTITANPTISVNTSTGVITATASASQSVTPTVSAGYVSSGTAGTVSVSGSNTESLSTVNGTTITPTESEQTAVAANKYTLGEVKVGAISSTYVGSGITSRSSTDLSASGATVTAPTGYYASAASTSVSSGTEGTPTATKGTVSSNSVTVTPSVTNSAGYISGGTHSGTAVTVSASELVSGNLALTQNNVTNVDVTNYATVSVAVAAGATNIVQGTFTTGSTRNTAETVSLSYSGSGYPIAFLVYVDGGAYNNSTGGNTTWYNSVNRYDVGWVGMVKSQTPVTPTYTTSGGANYGTIALIYKNSTSTSTTYTRTSSMTANTYTSSSTNPGNSTTCIRFKGNGKTLAYYVGNAGSSNIGLAPSTKYAYIVIYSS